jgi:hypothetical protein
MRQKPKFEVWNGEHTRDAYQAFIPTMVPVPLYTDAENKEGYQYHGLSLKFGTEDEKYEIEIHWPRNADKAPGIRLWHNGHFVGDMNLRAEMTFRLLQELGV